MSLFKKPKAARLQRSQYVDKPSSATLVLDDDDLAPVSLAPTSPRYQPGLELYQQPMYPLQDDLIPAGRLDAVSLRKSLGPPSSAGHHPLLRFQGTPQKLDAPLPSPPPEMPKRKASLRLKAMGNALKRTFSRKAPPSKAAPPPAKTPDSIRRPSFYSHGKPQPAPYTPITPITPGMNAQRRSHTRSSSQSSTTTVTHGNDFNVPPPFHQAQPDTPAFEDYTVPHHHPLPPLERRPSTPHPNRTRRNLPPVSVEHGPGPTMVYRAPSPQPDTRERIFVGPWRNRRGDQWLGISDIPGEPRILMATPADEFHPRFAHLPDNEFWFENPKGFVIDVRTLCMIHHPTP